MVCQILHCFSLCLYRGPFGGPQSKFCQKLHFSSLCLYRGPFGVPLSKFCQKMHFSSLCLCRGPFGGPQKKFCRKLHFSLRVVYIKGPSGPLSFRKGGTKPDVPISDFKLKSYDGKLKSYHRFLLNF